MTIANATIVGNTAHQPFGDASSDPRSSGNEGSGGGVFSLGYKDSKARLLIFNSIVANNVADKANPKDVVAMTKDGSITTVAANDLIRSSSGFVGRNILLVDPELGPLENNGGPSATMLPGPGSPVLGAGDPALGRDLFTDQRGFAPRVSNGKIDLGVVQADAKAFTQTDPTNATASVSRKPQQVLLPATSAVRSGLSTAEH
jgi:hypothetical protein